MTRRPVIAVIGSSSTDAPVLEMARRVGRAIAEAGCHLVCGGRGGVMSAACEGHRQGRGEAGLVTIGVLPGESPDGANPFVDVALPTGLGIARNAVITRSADGVVAIAGGSGTLSEIALAWQFGRPIAALVDSGGWAGQLAGRSLDQRFPVQIHAASGPEDAVRFIIQQLSVKPDR